MAAAFFTKRITGTRFFYKQHFYISNSRLKLAKYQGNAKEHPEAELLLFENYSYSFSTLSSKNNKTYSKNSKRTSASNSWNYRINHKMKMKMKNRSHRYDINRPRSRHKHKYKKYKKRLIIMIIISIKQHLSNNRGPIHENIKPRWGWVEKKALLIKKSIYISRWQNSFIYYKHAFTNIKETYLPHSENFFHLCMECFNLRAPNQGRYVA